jgi:crotonobetainyl-CoA:carnitine CoA-transferase CaiB-like acyl-CoA transferase
LKIKIAAIGASILLTATFAFAGLAYSNDKPSFVLKAESATNNFLMYTYGPGKCAASKGKGHQWEMVCSYDGGYDLIKYSVLPSESEKRNNTENFRLIAQNQLAAQSAASGLTRYLTISIDEI